MPEEAEAPTLNQSQCCCYSGMACPMCETHGTGPLMHHYVQVARLANLVKVPRGPKLEEVSRG